ncbi:penicillin-binding protein 1C [Xanthobacter dioxanivorans]|uniref:peptidoglycan glycosyltransferase n=1 Tax=Xanthobacter dioxanivorans TaxID=2528964 RepID=A0A974PJF6_9HYPH|nr:penicillin-binding protein 1C [Xanthobacter dioxanivorans]QRG04634.1 penicillin-binding protein 1C [Xanthobacter dioxanivorans]
MSEDRPQGPAPEGAASRSRRRAWQAGAAAVFAMGLLAGGAGAGLLHLRAQAPPAPEPNVSAEVVDREGRLLRPFALPDGRWRLAAGVEDVDPRLVAMILAYEDKRFEAHAGVDLIALVRAAGQAALSARVVSGGSTLTMQVARLTAPPRARTLAAKLEQMRRAIELEARLPKAEILRLYLTLAPYGGNIEGVRAASLTYFGKEPRHLTLGEAALLVALPQSPEARRPDRFAARARGARDRVLDRLLAQGVLSADEVRMAKGEPVPRARRAMPQLAPHLAEDLIAERPAVSRHASTLDAPLQERLEELLRERTKALGRGLSAAVVVMDNDSSEVRAYVGAADFADRARAGEVDLARAVRSPGSTLKPFIYAMAFEDGIAHPETLIEDRPARFGAWRPENFDRSFQGTLSVRKALQMSLNVPAVRLLDAVGPQRLATRLQQAGARLELPAGAAPALPMGLGGVGIRLIDLTSLYAALARGGEAHPPVFRQDGAAVAAPRRSRLVDEVAAWYVGQCLLGTPAPENALGGRIAFKTGTSYGYRDSWAVGFDGRRTVGVWVGRPDGQAVPDLTGRAAAAPLLFDAFARIVRTPAALRPVPRGAVVAANARLPVPQRHFGTSRKEQPLQVVFPPDGARVSLSGEEAAGLVLKVDGGTFPLTLLMDGRPVAREENAHTFTWRPPGRGFTRLTVMDAAGVTDSVTVRVE